MGLLIFLTVTVDVADSSHQVKYSRTRFRRTPYFTRLTNYLDRNII